MKGGVKAVRKTPLWRGGPSRSATEWDGGNREDWFPGGRGIRMALTLPFLGAA
jgi:hypothetical protein